MIKQPTPYGAHAAQATRCFAVMLALLSSFASASAQTPGDLRPAWSPDGRRIAFESMRDGNAEIYLLELESGAVRRLTDQLGDDRQPSWSPDGSRIVFASDRDRNTYSGRGWHQLYVMYADGSEAHRLVESGTADFMPRWSPDGRWIAFLSDRDGATGLYVVPSGGGEARALLPSGFREDAGDPSWSPDSRRIAFDAATDSAYDVFSVDVQTSEVVNLTGSEGPQWWFPAWSPDGRTLLAGVFTGDSDSGAHQILAIDLASGRRSPITPARPRSGRARDFWPSWSPDGSRIVFTSRRDGPWELYVVGADGRGERRLETHPGSIGRQ